MADLNALIAQGAQFRVPPPVDPMGNMAQLMQMRAAQNQNALAQYQLGAAQRTDEQQSAVNALSRDPSFDPRTAEGMRKALALGQPGYKLIESAHGAQKAGFEATQAQDKAIKERLALSREKLAGVTTPDEFRAWNQTTHADPILGPWFTSQGVTPEASNARIDAALAKGSDGFNQLLTESKVGVQKLAELGVPKQFAPPESIALQKQIDALPVGNPTRVAYESRMQALTDKTPSNVKEFAAFQKMDPAQQAEFLKFLASKTPKTSVSVAQSTEKGYGTQFAGEVAKGDVTLRAAAQDAPFAAENANRILQTLASGKPIVGAGADIKLGIAKLLNIAGVDNAEIISKTEGMVASMAQNTLNAIKTSGLGTGQGFTDKDLKFLEAAKSGNINFQPDTIRQLAELSHKAAEATATKWNSRAKEIPASAIQGTGVSLEPIQVPKRASSVTANVRPSGVGANWSLHSDANGNKAWVSPDGKQFKEVQQ